MKYFYALLVISAPFFAHAQSDTSKNSIDSVTYFSGEMARIERAIRDSIRHSQQYLQAKEGLHRNLAFSKGYNAFTLFVDVFGSDLRQLNNLLAQQGLPPMKDIGTRIGFGISVRENRGVVDLFYIVAGLNNKVKKDLEEVRTNLTSLFQMDVGYDLLNNQWFSVYPYAGLSLRVSNITYEEDGVFNPDYTSLADMVTGGKTTSLTSTRLGYQLGVGFDITYFNGGIKRNMFFVKAGINRPAWRDKYQKGDLPAYQAAIKQGTWVLTMGFKFGTKN